jgi:hypothetical protein
MPRGVERRHSVVVAAQERGDADERLVGQGPVLVGLDGGIAGNVREDLAAAVIDPEKARRAVETDALEVIEQGPCGRAGGAPGAPDAVPYPADPARVGETAVQALLAAVVRHDRHARCSSSLAIALWVTKDVTNPPRSAA